MNISEVRDRLDRIARDMGLVVSATKAIEEGLSTRTQAQSVIAEHVGAVRKGLEDVQALAIETHASIGEPPAAVRAPRVRAKARKSSRKRR